MDITEDIVSDFREWYEGFSDTTKYSNPAVIKALLKADYYTGSSRWGNYEFNLDSSKGQIATSIKAKGLFAYTAFILSISSGAAKSSGLGGIPTTPGAVSSKSVKSESVSFVRSTPQPGSSAFDDMMASNVYGAEFIGYQNAVSQGPIMV